MICAYQPNCRLPPRQKKSFVGQLDVVRSVDEPVGEAGYQQRVVGDARRISTGEPREVEEQLV
jgi:hypothetical protein